MFNGNNLYGSAACLLALVGAAAMIMAASEPATAFARAAGPATKQVVTGAAASGVTDLSARRRHRHYYGGNPAAGLAIMGAMIGTIGAIAAHQHDDDYYYEPGYYPGPGYYEPPSVYYAPRPDYGQPYYGHPHYGPHVRYYHPY